MKCYHHHQADAIGICKNCYKGVCIDCAIDVGPGIACQSSCEQSVKNLNEFIDRNKEIYKKTSSVYYRQAFISGLFGGFFILYGALMQKSLAKLLIPMGTIFLIGMISLILSGMKISRMNKD